MSAAALDDTVTNVAVVGGPLRTGRTSRIERVIRIAQAPHGALTGGALIDGGGRALGVVTGGTIRGGRFEIGIRAAAACPCRGRGSGGACEAARRVFEWSLIEI